jgi:hypothetical protein
MDSPAPTAALLNGAGEGNVSSADEVGLTVATRRSGEPLRRVLLRLPHRRLLLPTGADLPIEVTPWLSLVPAVQVGYGIRLLHQRCQSRLLPAASPTCCPPCLGSDQADKSAVLTPYIAYNISLDRSCAATALNTQDSEIFGGVKLRVSF